MKHLLCILLGILALSQVSAEEPASRPNILVIVSDDHGYADTGFQGCKDIPTPNLDSLAASGLQCTNGYVTHPFCSPTRAGLMTGRYQQRFGHENNPFYDPNDTHEGLPLTEKLLPEYLKAAGYATGWVGKWHLGAATGFRPVNRGFTETFGFIGGGHHYQNWAVRPAVEYNVPIERNGTPVEVTEHLTVAFGKEAGAFVRRHAHEPWFLYLAFNAPHTPHEPAPERLERFKSIADPKRRAYAAQVSLMDDAIGETLAELRASKQETRTLVFFFSDNGGPITQGSPNGSNNAPLRGGKGELYDGGVRVPFVISMPGTLKPGEKYESPVSSLDVFATSLALAGVAMPADKKYDSVNLLPFLKGENKATPHDKLFWRTAKKQWAIRSGDLKLVRHNGKDDELYNLKSDIAESRNLAAESPEAVKKLAAELDAWNKELIPPAFPGPAGRKPAGKGAIPGAEK